MRKKKDNLVDIAVDDKEEIRALILKLREGGKQLWQVFCAAHDVRLNHISNDTILRVESKSGNVDLKAVKEEILAMAAYMADGQPLTEAYIREQAEKGATKKKFDGDANHVSGSKGHAQRRTTGSVADFKPLKRQPEYIAMIKASGVVFGVGPAGTGKTYAATAVAVDALEKRDAKRIILIRPAQDAGEKLGFLPGNEKEKVSPYMRPYFDALRDFGYVGAKLQNLIANEEIEIAPVAFMRGRTLSDAYILVDEAQNLTIEQMKMVLTRQKNSHVIIMGDPDQPDIGKENGLTWALEVFRENPTQGVSIFPFTESDVVRDDMVARVLTAFNKHAEKHSRPKEAKPGPEQELLDAVATIGRISRRHKTRSARSRHGM